MANQTLFASTIGKLLPKTGVLNYEHAPAYAYSPKHALAQYAVTGCLNGTFYADAKQQLEQVLFLCEGLTPEFIARTAVYCREQGYMKDMPALLCAVLASKGPEQLALVFERVIDSGRMLRNFVQIIRSGATGRKSLSTRPRRLVRNWLQQAGDEQLFRAAVGQNPSLADIIRMVHPKPHTAGREAFYGYLLGRVHDGGQLPEIVKQFEAYKTDQSLALPDVPFQMLTSLPLRKAGWAAIAAQAGWQMTRMNLNTFARQGVFEVEGMAEKIADRLRDPLEIARAKVFPYQLLAAFGMVGAGILQIVRDALQGAMELALVNVPEVAGRIVVCPDVSGSMAAPVSGYRKGASSKVRCVDVAALLTAALLRKNSSARVVPFDTEVRLLELNARDSVLSNAAKLAGQCGGGTSCSAPLAWLNRQQFNADLVILVSDNQSWFDAGRQRSTETLHQWERFRQRNPAARLVCIDVQPYGTTQAAEREDILNIGGFSDQVFSLIASYAAGRMQAGHWVKLIEDSVL